MIAKNISSSDIEKSHITPGTWAVERGCSLCLITNADGSTAIAETDCCLDDGARVANTRLIVAAPELLRALLRILDEAEYGVTPAAIQAGVLAAKKALGKTRPRSERSIAHSNV